MRENSNTIAVAMSGGVDSTVTAALLQGQGYEVHGFYMSLGLPDQESQIDKVRKVADTLQVNLDIVDLAEDFQAEIISYFCQSYATGCTPNPCVVCNPLIKCGKLLKHVNKRGIEKMATGHYVRVKQDNDGWHLLKGKDAKKDQSYFLCGLGQQQLSRLVFPLGASTKLWVFEQAASLGFSQFAGTESQDICFLPGQGVGNFLKEKIAAAKGSIINLQGEKLGSHAGIFHYTVGQRRGLGICDSTPYYVVGLSAEKNQVIVGKEADLWHNELHVKKMNWVSGTLPQLPRKLHVKIRYRHQAAEAEVSVQNDTCRIVFTTPQRAITPGQFAVLYDGDELIGGGEITLTP